MRVIDWEKRLGHLAEFRLCVLEFDRKVGHEPDRAPFGP
ncbi:hypothetical protein GFS60_07167 (plasmid) [Rhodococcus sp. WAY2]|nr:hypothetical protein GFS60_07167 [Rhodococcus sp. WAY2]